MSKIADRIIDYISDDIVTGVSLSYGDTCCAMMCFDYPTIDVTDDGNIIIEENSDRIEFDVNDVTEIEEDEYFIKLHYGDFSITFDFE